jgi:hypothetical protein
MKNHPQYKETVFFNQEKPTSMPNKSRKEV